MWSDMALNHSAGFIPRGIGALNPSARSVIGYQLDPTTAPRTFDGVCMDYPDLPSSAGFQPAGQSAWLLAELYQVQVTLMISEYHHRWWRANSTTGNMSFFAYRSYAAHEAAHETGGDPRGAE